MAAHVLNVIKFFQYTFVHSRMEHFNSFCQFIHDSPNSITPTAMKPGGVFRELYVLKKLLFCFVNSGLDVPVRIIEFFG